MYCGRCAEKVLLKDISTSASNDLEKAIAMTNSKLVKIYNRSEFNQQIEEKSIEKISVKQIKNIIYKKS